MKEVGTFSLADAPTMGDNTGTPGAQNGGMVAGVDPDEVTVSFEQGAMGVINPAVQGPSGGNNPAQPGS